MKPEQIRDAFQSLAEKLGYTIRFERGDFRGDVCRIKAENVIIINRLTPIKHQNYAFSRIFADEDLSQISILPIIRDMIEEVKAEPSEYITVGDEDA